MSKYYSLLTASLRRQAQYPVAILMAFLQVALQICILYSVWNAVYQGEASIAGFTRTEMMTYLFVSQSISAVYGYRNSPDRLIAQNIRDGNISWELMRPLRFPVARLFENMGDSLLNAAFAGIIGMVLCLAFPEFTPPAGILDLALFFLSFVLGYFTLFLVYSISGYTVFITMNFWGVHAAQKAILDFLSGALIPIALFPAWAQKASMLLPFKNIIYAPTMFYLGKLEFREGLSMLFSQVIWNVILWFLGEFVYAKAVRRISINGG